jgi:phosphate starvation-inducible protein PhoH
MSASTIAQKRIPQRKSNRKERKQKTSQPVETQEKFNFALQNIQPLTKNQRLTFEDYANNMHMMLVGTPGTGKSFIAAYLGMKDIMEHETQEKMVIIRSVVPTRDMGFLPGSNKDKSKVYEAPYYDIFKELFKRGDAYEYLKTKGVVEFMTTSFVRGITINNAIIVVDEFQNMTASELHSVFTRIGKNCRIIFAGDIKQNDLQNNREFSGFSDFFRVISNMHSFSVVEFDKNDIVRSEIVKEYIIAREKLEELGKVKPL